MTPYPTPWEKVGKTLAAIRQPVCTRSYLRLNLQTCLFNGPTGPRHAALTSYPRRIQIAPKLAMSLKEMSAESKLTKSSSQLSPQHSLLITKFVISKSAPLPVEPLFFAGSPAYRKASSPAPDPALSSPFHS